MNRTIILAALLGFGPASQISAQQVEPPLRETLFEVSAVYGQPVGHFSDQIDGGLGIAGALRIPVPSTRRWSVRLDASAINYGREATDVCLSVAAACRVEAKQTTSNDIVTFGVGPEFALSEGWLQPFVHLHGGGVAFLTQSGLGGPFSFLPYSGFAMTTNQSDLAFAWGGGAGVRLEIPFEAAVAHIDLGARYHDSAPVEYLREGDIADLPVGSAVLNTQRSRARFLTYHIGASIRFRTPWSAADRD